jgi:hypothetical protein
MGLSSTDEAKETAMAEPWCGVVEKITDGLCPAHLQDYGQGLSDVGNVGSVEYP